MTKTQKELSKTFSELDNIKKVSLTEVDEMEKQKISDFISTIEQAHKQASESKLIFKKDLK